MKKHLTEKNLNDFTSNINYSYFDDVKVNCGNIDFHSDISSDLIQYHSLSRFSEDFAKALCFVYDNKVNHPNNFDKELCSYLYYWLGDKIYSNLNDTRVFSKLIRMFFDVLNEKNFPYMCDNPKTGIDKDTFNNNKLLFDYSKNHENIKLDTVYGDVTCDDKYKEVLLNYIKIYKDAYFSCKRINQNKHDCEYFKKLYPEDEYKKLSSFNCRKYNPPSLTAGIQGFEQNIISLPGVHGLEGNRGTEIQRVAGINDQHKFYSFSNPNRSSPETHILNEGEYPSTYNTTDGGSTKTIAGSVAPVLGVSSISLLLYKVTPLGGFIRNFLGRNRNMHNPVEYMDSFNPYSDGIVPGDRTMNISYHRL
ncbi:Plasmodium vivax Vir protein, putative [Plasmodium vivax]|uniref:Vir protein, putative n=1 Tax=Plasmodium vivax TaxID=5855 RepID=A0A1G4E0U7_PLAVI|nr:Plasmodium vivax Vir protein, putative [Plasmodium vivax]